jgi:hypothetical protein
MESPYIAILNKHVFFSKSESRKVKQVLSGGLIPVGVGRILGKGVGGSM